MQRNTYLLGLIGLLALASCGPDNTPGATNTLVGVTTQGRAQEAVVGATVNAGKMTTTTDSNGQFNLEVYGNRVNVTASKSGYAASTVENVDAQQAAPLDLIMLPVYDPELPAVSPTVQVNGVKDGDTVGDADLTLKVTVKTADPTRNPIKSAIASLEVPAGTSGTLNRGRVRQLFGDPRSTEEEVTFKKSDFAAYKGDLELHVVVYDLNGNRTDVIRHVKASGAANTAAVVAPTEVSPFALTYGDNVTFGAYQVSPAAVKAMLGGEAQAKTPDTQPQAAPAGKALWVDVDFVYTAPAPRAFELWRSLDGKTYSKVVSSAPASVVVSQDKGTYRLRDTGSALTPGVKTYYKVRAISDAGSADSDVQEVTPLGAFNVKLLAPAQATTGVDRVPIFRWSATGAAAKSYYHVIVLDRVQASGQTTAWVSEELEATEAVYNFDGLAALPRLQPYHAYDWQVAGITVSEDEKAAAIGADYFNLFGLSPLPSNPDTFTRSGPVHEFVTGGL